MNEIEIFDREPAKPWPVWLCGLTGAAAFLLMTVPAVAVVTAVLGFPVPFHGTASGLKDVPLAVAGATFMGCVTGVYLALAAVGAMAGLLLTDRPPGAMAVRLVAAGLAVDMSAAAVVSFIAPLG